MRKVSTLTIPKGLSTIVVRDRKVQKSISIYYCLKSLYVGGVIKDYRKRYKKICDEIGVSEKTLRTYISFLKKENLVHVKNNHLFISSKNILRKKYDLPKYNHKIKFTRSYDYKKTQYLFVALSIKENYVKQEYSAKKKLTKDYIQKKSKFYKGKLYRNMIKSYKERIDEHFNVFLSEEKKRFQKNVINSVRLNKPIKGYNPEITLSRKGVARLKNCLSASTGFSTIKKLKEYSFIEKDTANNILIENGNIYDYYNIIFNNNSLFINNGLLYYKGVNTLRLREGSIFP